MVATKHLMQRGLWSDFPNLCLKITAWCFWNPKPVGNQHMAIYNRYEPQVLTLLLWETLYLMRYECPRTNKKFDEVGERTRMEKAIQRYVFMCSNASLASIESATKEKYLASRIQSRMVINTGIRRHYIQRKESRKKISQSTCPEKKNPPLRVLRWHRGSSIEDTRTGAPRDGCSRRGTGTMGRELHPKAQTH